MRKAIVSFMLIGLIIAPSFALAHEKSSKGSRETKGERVYCCWGKGKCDKQHTQSECEKEGGKVVKHCRDCK